jgi:hypothetical protein
MPGGCTLSGKWRSDLDGLTAFIQSHPEIRIGKSSVVIPATVRQDFYRLFDETRHSVVEDMLPAFLPYALELGERFKDTEGSLVRKLCLDEVLAPNPVGWFLLDPAEGLSRLLFDPLFELLKGKTDIEAFEHFSEKELTAGLEKLYQRGYEIWLALCLALSLGAVASYSVALRRPSEHREWTIIRAGKSEEAVPPPAQSRAISFEHLPEHLFSVPDFIIRSGDGGYYAFMAGLNSAIATAINASAEREWLGYDGPLYSDSGPLLVFAGDSLDEVKLVADASRICRPDVVVQTAGPDKSSDEKCVSRAKYWFDTLKPLQGSLAILNEPSESVPPPEGVEIIEAGFGPQTVETLIAAIAGRQKGL